MRSTKMAKRKFKVKKALSGGSQNYRSWDKWSEDEYIIGIYRGEGPTDSYKKPTFQFMVEEAHTTDNKFNKSIVGKILTLNTNTNFEKQMEEVEEEDICQVTYAGEYEVTKGKYKGKTGHNVKVDILAEDDSDDDSESESDDEEYETEEDDL